MLILLLLFSHIFFRRHRTWPKWRTLTISTLTFCGRPTSIHRRPLASYRWVQCNLPANLVNKSIKQHAVQAARTRSNPTSPARKKRAIVVQDNSPLTNTSTGTNTTSNSTVVDKPGVRTIKFLLISTLLFSLAAVNTRTRTSRARRSVSNGENNQPCKVEDDQLKVQAEWAHVRVVLRNSRCEHVHTISVLHGIRSL